MTDRPTQPLNTGGAMPLVGPGLRKVGRDSVADLVLRWGIPRGTSIVAKTTRPERLRENAALFDFAPGEADMRAISALDRGQRFDDPGVFAEKAFDTFYPIYE